MRKIKIISDGTSAGTRFTDAETGERISRVQEFKIHARAGQGKICAEVTQLMEVAEIEVPAEIKQVQP